MLELAKIIDSFPSGPKLTHITFDVEVANGNIQLSFDRASNTFVESMVSLAFACGLDGMSDTHQLNGIPFMLERGQGGPIQLYRIENAGDKPS